MLDKDLWHQKKLPRLFSRISRIHANEIRTVSTEVLRSQLMCFRLSPLPEPYLGRKCRRVRYVKTDPIYICFLYTASLCPLSLDLLLQY